MAITSTIRCYFMKYSEELDLADNESIINSSFGEHGVELLILVRKEKIVSSVKEDKPEAKNGWE